MSQQSTPKRQQSSSRMSGFRASLQRGGTDVEGQRKNRRKSFMDQFKLLRVKEIDHLRGLSEEDLDYKTLLEIRKLLASVDEAELVSDQEVQRIKAEIENELRLLEAEDYERTTREETDAAINSLMEKCIICDTFIENSNICQNCEGNFN